jgi:branched-chain amino acid transport system permease protein
VLAFLEVIPTALAGIADILPAGSVPPAVHDTLAQWLPSSLSSYRDAFVFVFLILVLLFRPQGILRGRAREETP